MTSFKKFSGINNVKPSERLANNELSQAMNVDIGVDNEVRRRRGFSQIANGVHHSVWDTPTGKTLAVVGSNLKNVTDDITLHIGVGAARMWYGALPDDSIVYGNGLYSGIIGADGSTRTSWGVIAPATIGAMQPGAGQLYAGQYRYALSHVRADGRESGLVYSAPFTLDDGQTITLAGLDVLTDHTTNVYLTPANGGEFYLAGNTSSDTYTFTDFPTDLTIPARTDLLSGPPLGVTQPAAWRGRALCVVGSVLWASMPHMWHLFNLRRDFKQFEDPITMVMPLTDGIYVGTTKRLYWLAGAEWDKLVMNSVMDGGVILGSGVAAPGEQIKRSESNGQPIHGSDGAMLCICDGRIVAGFNSGDISRMTEGVYHRTDLDSVSATFRTVRGVPQYIAAKYVPQIA